MIVNQLVSQHAETCRGLAQIYIVLLCYLRHVVDVEHFSACPL